MVCKTTFNFTLLTVASLCLAGCRGPRGAQSGLASSAITTQSQPPVRYIVAGPVPADAASIRFEFPPPEDAYRGEVRRVRGELVFGDLQQQSASRGWFEVDITDVTMGDADLDENVRYNIEFLEGRRFPLARFEVDRLIEESAAKDPESGRRVVLEGQFTLKGRTVPLSVHATLRPTGGDPRRADLILETRWTLEKLEERFGIIGPGSPVAEDDLHAADAAGEPAGSEKPHGRPGDRLNFHLRVLLKRAAQ